MDAQTPRGEELNDFERRLAGWRPDAEGLGADAMLFAAGAASARRGPGRVLWPGLSLLLAVLAAGLGAWGLSERAGREALAERLRQRAPAAGEPAPTTLAVAPQPSYAPSLDDYFHLRRQLEQDPGRWLAAAPNVGPPPAPPPAGPPMLRGGQRDDLPDL
jgi:hypothetical protein